MQTAQLTEAGREWIVDATGIAKEPLRDLARIRSVVDRLVVEAGLSPLGVPQWHVFPGEAGVTGLVMLSESHVAVHTFPELGLATFNLYCCRPRPEWPWGERLREMLGAREVTVRVVDRGGVRKDAKEAAE
ncbi:MAG: S-adenosylmethionine decarboxylase family protein [Polyangiales bacterium]